MLCGEAFPVVKKHATKQPDPFHNCQASIGAKNTPNNSSTGTGNNKKRDGGKGARRGCRLFPCSQRKNIVDSTIEPSKAAGCSSKRSGSREYSLSGLWATFFFFSRTIEHGTKYGEQSRLGEAIGKRATSGLSWSTRTVHSY